MEPTVYATTDFYLACWLCYAGHPFAGLTFDPSGKATFLFEGVTKEDVLHYYNRELKPIDPLGFVAAIRHTRELLYNYPRS